MLLLAVLFGLFNLKPIGVWVMAGQQMRPVTTSEGRLRAFNITMAVLILAPLKPMLRGV